MTIAQRLGMFFPALAISTNDLSCLQHRLHTTKDTFKLTTKFEFVLYLNILVMPQVWF